MQGLIAISTRRNRSLVIALALSAQHTKAVEEQIRLNHRIIDSDVSLTRLTSLRTEEAPALPARGLSLTQLVMLYRASLPAR